MAKPLRALIVEANEDDVVLLTHELRGSGFDVQSQVVETAEAMSVALASGPWDVILSDYGLPHFDALQALELLQKSGKEIPLIIVSGTAGEEAAVGSMRAGARDYFSKMHLARLVPAIERELAEAGERRRRREAERMRDRIFDLSLDLLCFADFQGFFRQLNPSWTRALGWSNEELLSRPFLDFVHPDDRDATVQAMQKLSAGQPVVGFQNRNRSRDGSFRWLSWNAFPLMQEQLICANARDITELKEKEASIEGQRQLLADMFSSIQHGLSVLDRDFTILRVNPTMERWFAHAMPLVGKKCYEAYHGRHAPCETCPTRRALETMQPAREVVPERDASGASVRWMDLFSFPLIDSATGEMQGVVEYVSDITEQKQAEELLRLQSAVVEHMTEGLVLIRSDEATIVYANQKFEKMFGYGPGELKGKHASVLNAGRDKSSQAVAAEIVRAMKESGAWCGDIENVRKDGSHFWCSASVTCLDHPTYGKIWISIHQDITERCRAEEALRRNEEQHRTIIDNISDIIFLCDPEGTITFITENVVGWGYDASEVLGHNIAEFIFPEDFAHVIEDLQQMVRRGETVTMTMRMRGKHGGINYFETIGKPIIEAGNIVRIVGVLRDITERRKAEARLTTLNRALMTLSGANRVLSRADDEQELLNEICRIIVEVGGYAKAWVSYAEEGERRMIRPVAWIGFEKDELEGADMSWDDEGGSDFPTARAIRSGEPVIVMDAQEATAGLPWHESVVRSGCVALAALPLIADGKTIGALTTYASEQPSFDAEELDLLKELASDMAYGIKSIRVRSELVQTEQEIERRMFQLARLNDLMIGREMRVIEVKREVNTLLVELDRAPKYAV